MGIKQSSINQEDLNQSFDQLRTLQGIPGEPTLARLANSHLQVEKYELKIPDQDKQFQTAILASRKNQCHKNIVRVAQFQASQDCVGCIQCRQNFTVFTQHIPYRLTNLSWITIPEAIYILYESLCGYGQISKRRSLYYPTAQKIGITEKSEIKVWINEIWAINNNKGSRQVAREDLFINELIEIIKEKVVMEQSKTFSEIAYCFPRKFIDAENYIKNRYFRDIQSGHFMLQDQINKKYQKINNKDPLYQQASENRQFRSYSEGGKRVVAPVYKPKTVAISHPNQFYQSLVHDGRRDDFQDNYFRELQPQQNHRFYNHIATSHTKKSFQKTLESPITSKASKSGLNRVNFNYIKTQPEPHVLQLPYRQKNEIKKDLSVRLKIPQTRGHSFTQNIYTRSFNVQSKDNLPLNKIHNKSFDMKKDVSGITKVSYSPFNTQIRQETSKPQVEHEPKQRVHFSYNSIRMKRKNQVLPNIVYDNTHQPAIQPFQLGLQLQGIMNRQHQRKITPGAKTVSSRVDSCEKNQRPTQHRSERTTQNQMSYKYEADEDPSGHSIQRIKNLEIYEIEQHKAEDQPSSYNFDSPPVKDSQQHKENQASDSKQAAEEFKFYLRSSQPMNQSVEQIEQTPHPDLEGDSRCIIERWDEEQSFSHKS